MSQEFGCSFCEQLPESSACGWGGRQSKCPVCKQPLWTDQAGGTHRIVAGASAPARRWPLFVGSGAAALCVLIAIAAWFHPRSTPQPGLAPEYAAPAVRRVPRETPVEPLPVARAKPAQGHIAARAKPTAAAKPVATVVAAALVEPKPVQEARKMEAPAPAPPPVYSFQANLVDLKVELRAVPEVDFEPQYAKKTAKDLAEMTRNIAKTNKKPPTEMKGADQDKTKAPEHQDAFIRGLIKDRPDLAGMPFLLGKDCTLPAAESKALSESSLAIRAAFAAEVRGSQPKTSPSTGNLEPAAQAVWSRLVSKNYSAWKKDDRLPALRQIMTAESDEFRRGLVWHAWDILGPKGSELLANRALFDLDAEIRSRAIDALAARPKKEYQAALTKALRYPWAPVVRHAAHAIVTLDVTDAIPEMVALLDEAPPGAAFPVRGDDGKVKLMVRELVRVNHHRNCLLCHAPLAGDEDARTLRDLPAGPIPNPQQPLPPSRSEVYYRVDRGELVVRADITYLRQDFSLAMEVDNPGKWSRMQRYDFLVRTRELTKKEIDERPPPAVLEYRDTLIAALRQMTGKQAQPTAQSWREALGLPAPAK